MAITYEAQCPVHHTKLVCKNEDLVTVTSNGGKKENRPIFFCASCKRFYAYSPKQGIRDSKREYKGYPQSWANIKFSKVLDTAGMTDSIWKTGTGSIGSGSGRRFIGSKTTGTEDGKGGKTSSTTVVKSSSNERTVRIHELRMEEIEPRLKTNYNNVRAVYPMLTKDSDTIMDLIKKVFPSNLNQNVVIRNETVMGNNVLYRRVEIYNKNSSYLSHRLPAGVYLSFGGKVTNGEFYVNELRILENPILKEDDTEVSLPFVYDGPKHPNWLYELTKYEAKNAHKIKGELGDWNDSWPSFASVV